MWSSSTDPETVRNAWHMGLAEKYADMSSDFFMCMMPFNEMAIDWKSMAMDADSAIAEAMGM